MISSEILSRLDEERTENIGNVDLYYKAIFFLAKIHAWEEFDQLLSAIDARNGFETCPIDYVASVLYSLALK